MADNISLIKNYCDAHALSLVWKYERTGGIDHNPEFTGTMSVIKDDILIAAAEHSLTGSTKTLKAIVAGQLYPMLVKKHQRESEQTGDVVVDTFELVTQFQTIKRDNEYYLRTTDISTTQLFVKIPAQTQAHGIASKLLSNSAMRTQIALTNAHVAVCDRYLDVNSTALSVVVALSDTNVLRDQIMNTPISVDSASGVNYRRFRGNIYILSMSFINANYGYVRALFKMMQQNRTVVTENEISIIRSK